MKCGRTVTLLVVIAAAVQRIPTTATGAWSRASVPPTRPSRRRRATRAAAWTRGSTVRRAATSRAASSWAARRGPVRDQLRVGPVLGRLRRHWGHQL